MSAEKREKFRFTIFKEMVADERGMSTIALFILGLPLIIVAFGIGFDSLRYIYLKEQMQSVLDATAQTAVTYAVPGEDGVTGEPYLTFSVDSSVGQYEGFVKGEEFYKTNTAALRSKKIFCTPTAASSSTCDTTRPKSLSFSIINTPTGSPDYILGSDVCRNVSDPNSRRYGMQVVAEEKVNATFLRIVGVQSYDLKLDSAAYVRGRAC